VKFGVFRESLSVFREKKVRHAGESRHPKDCNGETTVSWIPASAGIDEIRNRIESTVLEP
jgi:hypothetical protein